LSRFIKSRKTTGTKDTYQYYIIEFFEFINRNPDEYLIEDYEFLPLEEKKKTSKKYKRDIVDFKIHLLNTPNKYGRDNKNTTIRATLYGIKSLFRFNEIDFSEQFWKQTIDFSNSKSSIVETPTHEQLRNILDNTDLQGKCLFFIMATSGSRITSVINLRRKDIDMENEYPIVNFYYGNVKNRKTKKKRVTPETKHFLESYFEKMKFKDNDYIFPSPLSKEDKKDENKRFEKPMSRQNANYKWITAIEKTNLNSIDENTNRLTMTTHCLKRFFKVYTAGINNPLSKFFLEHGNLNDTYLIMPDKEFDKQYTKFVDNLLIYEKPIDSDSRISQLTKELNETKGKLKIMTDKVTPLENKNIKFEERLNEFEKRMEESLNLNEPENIPILNTAVKLAKRQKDLPKEEIKNIDELQEALKSGKLTLKDLINSAFKGDLETIQKKLKKDKS
jgi:integrase